MQLKRDAPPVFWRSFGVWWMLAWVGGYTCGAGAQFLIFPGLSMIIRPYAFGDHWPLHIFYFWASLFLPFFGPVLASVIQWQLLRRYLANPFQWVKFTIVGAVCGTAISYGFNFLNPFSTLDMLCGLIDCGIEVTPDGEDFVPIWFIYGMVIAFVTYLPIVISQGLAWRPLGLPLAWWCLVSISSQFLLNIPLILLATHYEPGLEQLVVSMMGTMLLTLLANLVSAAITGLVVGLVTALFILPLLRRQIKLNHESPFAD